MILPEDIRDEAKAALVAEYLKHYAKYERYAYVAKDLAHDDQPEAYRYLLSKAHKAMVFLDGFKAAAEVMGISDAEFLQAVREIGEGGDAQ